MAALLVERATHPDGPPFWGPSPKRELLVLVTYLRGATLPHPDEGEREAFKQ
jgi:hypothetical protein